MGVRRVKENENLAFDTRQLSLGTICVSAGVWGDELGRVSQLAVLGGIFDEVIAYLKKRLACVR
jgi:hypothetical protein